MPRLGRIVQNVLSNWVALAVTTAVGFFLSPFVVHHLGNVVYGVWVLVSSLVAYVGLLDLGLRGAVTRYVSKDVTQANYEDANHTISGALWIRMWISLAVMCAGLALAAGFNHIFEVPTALQTDARFAVVFSATSVAINLWCGVFGAVLVALHRYDLTSAISILQTCVRAAGVVMLLRGGHGLFALATWDLCMTVAYNATLAATCFRTYPQLKVAFRCPSRMTVNKLWTYSLYVFLINVSLQITYYTDNVVVGAFLSPAAVTLYAIGGVLITYARQIVTAMTTTFTPLASSYEAEGGLDRLRQLLTHGTRAALIVSLPITAGLFFRGHTFIRLWMGDQYSHPSGTVMQILLISVVFGCANTTSGGIAYGMEKHKRIAFWAMGEAVANLALSVILVRRIGIYGVAWGTSIPSVIVELLLWPRYIATLLGIPVRTYLWQTWCRSAIAVVPFAGACAITERIWPANTLAMFCVQMVTLLPIVPLALTLVFHNEVSGQFQRWRTKIHSSRSSANEYKPSPISLV